MRGRVGAGGWYQHLCIVGARLHEVAWLENHRVLQLRGAAADGAGAVEDVGEAVPIARKHVAEGATLPHFDVHQQPGITQLDGPCKALPRRTQLLRSLCWCTMPQGLCRAANPL